MLDRKETAVLVVFAGVLLFASGFAPQRAMSDETNSITGFAWSDSIGWISLHCADMGTCESAPYGLTVQDDNTITGYAWSEYIGWVQFGGLSGFPAGAGTVAANAAIIGSSVVGWARAIAYDDSDGGWDGWISLSGDGYGLTKQDDAILGYAWGDTIGWLDFSADYACASDAGYFCSGNMRMYRDAACNESVIETCVQCSSGACLVPPDTPPPSGALGGGTAIRVVPPIVRPGETVQVAWNTEGSASCALSEDNPAIDDAWTGVFGSETSSPISARTTYTLDCVGVGGVRLIQNVTVHILPRWRDRQ